MGTILVVDVAAFLLFLFAFCSLIFLFLVLFCCCSQVGFLRLAMLTHSGVV